MREVMPSLDKDERIKSFEEVNLGYSKKQAMIEASRCLQCKVPLCEKGCPVNVPIKDFISLIKGGNIDQALDSIKEKNNLPGICGRVCPQEDQCEKACILGIKGKPIAIGNLERFVADNASRKNIPDVSSNGKKICIVGSGPAGLTCAAELGKSGYSVTIFEALHKPGGVLVYGIPEFRLPKSIVEEEIDFIKDLGVKIEKNVVIGKTYSLSDLRESFDAVFISLGAGLPRFLDIKGENLLGVYSANEYLTRINLMKAYLFPKNKTPITKAKKVIVIGGGNVAMDCARVARRMGAEVIISYRRTSEEMPARLEEIKHAQEEGIIFRFLTSPICLTGQKKVDGIVFQQMKLGEPDSTGRRKPISIEGKTENVGCDSVIIAIGQVPNPLLKKTAPELRFTNKGTIEVDEYLMTNLPGVFAGGDIISGGATVILAMRDGKKAAESIVDYFNKFTTN